MEDLARQVLLDRRFRAIRNVTACLCQSLSAEDCAVQSMPDASPAKWHLAHTTWFFETFVLGPNAPDYSVFHPRFEVLFNSYYNSVGAQYPRAERGLLTRPSLDEVGRYRAHVEAAMSALLTGPRPLDEPVLDVIEIGLNHEQQHQELLLTDIKHLLSRNPLAPVFRASKEPHSSLDRALAWHAYEGGLSEIGSDGSGFAFDNELPRHRVYLEPFELASRPVRNDEYLAFVEDDGYARPELWLAEGFTKSQEAGWRAPLYWTWDGDQWSTFTLSGLRPLRMEEPVCHVSFYEADAFARWSGARLPTEAEWERAAIDCPIEGNFLEGGRFHPDAACPRAKHDAPDQLHGDVWEWTASPYSPYPGFRASSGAIGEYNGKFMASQFVLRGGSCVSPRSHLRATYRNFFYPDARWQFSGVRLARDAATASD